MSEVNDPDDGCDTKQSIQIDSFMRETLQRSLEVHEQTLDVVKSLLDEVRRLGGHFPLLSREVQTQLENVGDSDKATLASTQYSAVRHSEEFQAQHNLGIGRQRSFNYDQRIANLSQLLASAGGKNGSLNDPEIRNRFIKLRSDIDTLVRSHLTVVPSHLGYAISKMGRRTSPDIASLLIRGFVADWLYRCFFNGTTRLFGIEDSWEVFKLSEKKLEQSGMAEDDLTVWRNLIVKTALKNSTYKDSRFLTDEAGRIWKNLNGYRSKKRKSKAAFDDFLEICWQAYELALLFRSSAVEYEWRQCEDSPDDHDMDILGAEDVSIYNAFEVGKVGWTIFGGVYRGDLATGKLVDNAMRILKPSVIVTPD